MPSYVVRIEPPRVRTVLLRLDRELIPARPVRLAFPHIIFLEDKFLNDQQHVFVSRGYPKDFTLDVYRSRQIFRTDSLTLGCAVPFYEFPLVAHVRQKGSYILTRVRVMSHISASGLVCYSSSLRVNNIPLGEKFWSSPFRKFDSDFVDAWERATAEKGLAASKMTLRHRLSSSPATYKTPYEAGDWN